MWREEAGTGRSTLALSRGAGCDQEGEGGYEAYTLRRRPTLPWPRLVQRTGCRWVEPDQAVGDRLENFGV